MHNITSEHSLKTVFQTSYFVNSNLIKCYIRTIYPVSKYSISFCFYVRMHSIFKMVTFSTKLPPFSQCHILKIV